MKRFLALGAALSCMIAPAAAETMDASGIGYGTTDPQTFPITEQLTVIQASTEYERFEVGEGNPMGGFKGPCAGTVVINAGNVSGGGSCRYTDADGDIAVIWWEADGMSAENRTQGTWTIIGGTGKWLAASGGGRFDAGEDEASGYTNNVSGEVTLP